MEMKLEKIFYYLGVATFSYFIVSHGNLNMANIVFSAACIGLFDMICESLKKK